ncbi:MAG TPA: alpha/beta fold hydrolase [Candidatus Binataceae bacterium]|nr:alpha/beta fold hydrolase [Candidatus Binataceae bacterium]
MPTKYADVNGYAIYYYYTGKTTLPDVVPDFSKGHALLLLHRAGSNGHAWHYQYERLGERHSPIALDLPGHGRSSGVEGLRTVEDYAAFTRAFLDALKLESAVIAGHSMGGAIALEVALRYPDRVKALILVATAAKFEIPKERIETWRAVTMGRASQPFNNDGYSPKTIAAKPEIIREGWGEQIQTDPRVRWGDLVACSQADLRDRLNRVEKPTLILAGADDSITPPADAEFLKSRIKGARLELVPDASHRLTTEQPETANNAIEKFLSELR